MGKLDQIFSSWENGDFLGVKSVVPPSTLKMRKSKKNLYAHTHAYTQIRDHGGISLFKLATTVGFKTLPPGAQNMKFHSNFEIKTKFQMIIAFFDPICLSYSLKMFYFTPISN